MNDTRLILDLLDERASCEPETVLYRFLNDGERESGALQAAELKAKALGVADFLCRSTPPGARVVLAFAPGLPFIVAFYGCLYAGRLPVPCYPPRAKRRSIDEFRAIAENAGASLVLSAEPTSSKLSGWLREIGNWNFPVHDISLFGSAFQRGVERPGPEDVAFLQYTSGSTGVPKGVIINHRNVVANLHAIREAWGWTDASRPVGVLWLPPYHDMGLIGGVLLPVYVGGCAVLMPPSAFVQKPLRWLQAISDYGAESSGGPNFAYDLCVQRIPVEQRTALDLSRWRVAFNGAEPVRADTLDRFSESFASRGFRPSSFLSCYGMAETTLLIAGVDLDVCPARSSHPDRGAGEPQRAELVSCGRVRGGADVRIVDPDTLAERSEGAVGEIWVAGESVAQGYWNRPELTRDTFGALLPGRDTPFLRTGDLGFFSDGELYISGRSKDLIIIRGKNYYPQDIERAAQGACGVLLEGHGAAFGWKHNGEECLVFVNEVMRTALADLNVDEVAMTLKREIAETFGIQVHAIVLVKPGTIPKTSSGKIRRYLCKERFESGALDVVGDWHRAATEEEHVELPGRHEHDVGRSREVVARWLTATIAQETGAPAHTIEPSRPLADFGLDSLLLARIAGELGDWLGIALPPNLIEEYPSVERLSDYVGTLRDLAAVLAGRSEDERRALVASVATERGARHASIGEIPQAYCDVSALEPYAELQSRQQILALTGLRSPFYTLHEGINTNHTSIDGRDMLHFSGNNYLGIAQHAEAIDATCEAVRTYGTSVSASRIVSGERPVHRHLEARLAQFIGVDDAMILVAGNLTNTSLVGHLCGRNDLIVYDELSHDSLRQGAQLSGADMIPFAHNDLRHVERILSDKRLRYDKVLLFSEGTFSMDGDFPDLPKLVELKKTYRALLMMDEALSMGVMGKTGRGITEHFGVNPKDVDIMMGVLSKALAGCGGYIGGSKQLMNYLRFSLPGFIYTTGMSPANAAASLSALDIIQREPERVAVLQQRVRLFLDLAQRQGLNTGRSGDSCVVPVIVGDSPACMLLHQRLFQEGINVQPVVHPAVPKDSARLRFFLTCSHTEDEIRFTVDKVATLLRQIRGVDAQPASVGEAGNVVVA